MENEEEERLTNALRAWNPRLSLDGSKIVFCSGSDGTVNVGVCDADGRNIRQVTSFANGEQVYTPVWSPDGTTIAFGYSTGQRQSLAIIREDGSDFRVLVSGIDARNPCFDPGGSSLAYAANERGIYNVFTVALASGARRRLTNVLGGAFLPTFSNSGALAFASYTSSGYKIAYMSNPQLTAVPFEPLSLQEAESTGGARGGSPVVSSASQSALNARPYRNTFTSLSIIPLIRVDNYNPKNKGIDVIRPGIYFMSSDVLDKLTLFGGAVINRQFERDLFAIVEYRDAIPLLYQLGLAPTLSVEVYNISRKTDVSFPLFTDREHMIQTDVTYNLLEFDISLRQKVLDEHTQLTLGYTLSRYNADVGSFVVPPIGLSPGFRNVYLIGNTLFAHLTHDAIQPSVDRDIKPVGRAISLQYGYDFNKFNPEGEYKVEKGVLVPQYSKPSFHKLEAQWNEHLSLPLAKHTLTLTARGGTTFGKTVDDFFDFYAGGFIGMRGYPYYSLGGSDFTVLSATYRFPLWTKINSRFLQFFFTKLYGSVFADFGDAWSGPAPGIGNWKKDAGIELRLEAFSFYQYPTRISFAGAYGFDRFTRTFNNADVTYGREWRFYVGVLFGFELNPDAHAPRYAPKRFQ